MIRWSRCMCVMLLSLALSGCQTVQGVGQKLQGAVDQVMGSQGQRLDPWESWNRKVFAFNDKLDTAVLKPVATAYVEVVPSPVRQGIGNFFGNISDAWSAVNLLLQGRVKAGLEQGMRFAVNSTFGLVGLIDIATDAGLEKNSQDFGKTLGKWGMGTGAYIVWPLLGPSSVRDTIGLPFDWQASPGAYFDNSHKKVAVTVLGGVSTRASFLRAGELFEDIALDKYTFYRDAYLQRRGSFDDDDAVEVLVPADAASAPAAAASTPAATMKKPTEPASAATR